MDETITCDGSLTRLVAGSVTTSWTMKLPGTSATKLGVAVLAPSSAAELPKGCETKLHAYCRFVGRVLGAKEPLPSRCTVWPTVIVWFVPATAVGGSVTCGAGVAMENGRLPTPTVATTVLSAVAITETVLSFPFVTYTKAPSALTAASIGKPPT